VGNESKSTWQRLLRFVVLAGAAAFVIYALGGRSQPVSSPFKPPAERKPLSSFGLPQLDGAEWVLSENRGKVLLLNFWATWCPPCRQETPELVQLHQRYQSQGFAVVGISLDEQQGAVAPFVARYRIPYPVLLTDENFALGAQIESLPTSVLLDRQGRVATAYNGAVTEEDLRQDVERLLQEP
jgi:thiol-disulfide isomerase/thioredoxin